ncbi:MAG TPA: hypothetical protein VGM94_10255 [Galbitalea sp.]|jgi:hypothetical protein
MSTIRTPVGPQPPKTYWRRRLLVLLGVLVVILIIILLIVRPGGSPKAAPSNTPKPASTTSSTPAVTTCKPAALDVEAVTDAVTYAAGVEPKLSLTITNNGAAACTFKVGTDVQEYTITSGTEKIWSSKDCQTNPVADTVTLQPGTPVQSTPFPWDRTRSDPATCKSTTRPKVIANGASYHLGVTVNGVASAKSRQFILK